MSAKDQNTAGSLEPASEHQSFDHVDDGQPSNELELSRDTIIKLASTGLSFLFSGMNDGSLGALIPYLIRSYGIDTDLVSVV